MSKQRSWTDEEYGYIQDHPDWTAAEIAEELDRTAVSVRQKRRSLAKGWSDSRNLWSESQDMLILESPDLTADELAGLLGRTRGSVEARRKRLIAAGKALPQRGQNSPFSMGSRTVVAKTCRKCGLLLPGRWFHFNATLGYSTSYCTRCTQGSRESAKAFARQAAIITAAAANMNKHWTEPDFEVLARKDLTLTEKALILGRTYRATSNATSRNGFTSKPSLGDPAEQRWIIDNPNAKEYAL